MIVVAMTCILRYHSLGVAFERNITGYAYIAHEILSGGKLYTDVFDMKPPGVFLIYGLAELAWGYSDLAIINLLLLSTLISQIFIYLYIYKRTNKWVAIYSVFLWGLASNSLLLKANLPSIEIFINIFIVMIIWSFSKYYDTRKWSYILLAGLGMAAASYLKSNFIFIALFMSAYLLIYDLLANKISMADALIHFSILAVPGAVLWLGTLGYFYADNRLNDLLWQFSVSKIYALNIWKNIMRFFTETRFYYPRALVELKTLLFTTPLFIFGILKPEKLFGKSLLLTVLFGGLLMVGSTPQNFIYYYQVLLPPVVLLSSLIIYDIHILIKNRMKWPVTILLMLFMCSSLVFHQFKFLQMDKTQIADANYGWEFINIRRMAQEIKRMTRPDDLIYVYGSETGVYYYAQRRSAASDIYIEHIIGLPKEMRLKAESKLVRMLYENNPKIIIYNSTIGNIENAAIFPIIKAEYNFLKKFEYFDLYQRKF